MYSDQLNEIIKRLDILINHQRTPGIANVYTVEEVAKMLNLSRSTIDRAIRDRQLRPYKLGDWRISLEHLNEWLESRRPVKRK